jgi:hypothetical protein
LITGKDLGWTPFGTSRRLREGGWVSMLPAAVDWWFLPWRTCQAHATIHAVAADSGINLFHNQLGAAP